MEKLVFAGSALIAVLTGCNADKIKVDREADLAALEEAKVVTWRKLYYENDADGLDAFLADDFVLIGGNEKFSPKIQEVEWLRNNSWNGPEDFVYTIEDIIFLNDDAAIVFGVGTSTRSTDTGEPCKHTYISSNTLRREGDNWRPVTSHVSDANCAPITVE